MTFPTPNGALLKRNHLRPHLDGPAVTSASLLPLPIAQASRVLTPEDFQIAVSASAARLLIGDTLLASPGPPLPSGDISQVRGCFGASSAGPEYAYYSARIGDKAKAARISAIGEKLKAAAKAACATDGSTVCGSDEKCVIDDDPHDWDSREITTEDRDSRDPIRREQHREAKARAKPLDPPDDTPADERRYVRIWVPWGICHGECKK